MRQSMAHINRHRPPALLLENVMGITDRREQEEKSALDLIMEELVSFGYHVHAFHVSLAELIMVERSRTPPPPHLCARSPSAFPDSLVVGFNIPWLSPCPFMYPLRRHRLSSSVVAIASQQARPACLPGSHVVCHSASLEVLFIFICVIGSLQASNYYYRA
jgi:hypothetical protein